jgi:tRNA threonylcarbamoyladenosine biosynthesis protein TsaE
MSYTIITESPEKTYALGKMLGGMLSAGDVLGLSGDLGAGKTRFAQGVAAGLGVQENVTSPTFTLINEYDGRLPFYHMDVYRLGGPDDMADLGYQEYFYGQGVTLVEWAGLVEDVLPRERLDINIINDDGENRRKINLLPRGERYEKLAWEMNNF